MLFSSRYLNWNIYSKYYSICCLYTTHALDGISIRMIRICDNTLTKPLKLFYQKPY